MDDKQDKWIESAMNSLDGSRRAQADPGLLWRIEDQLGFSKMRVISIQKIRTMAAAAAVLLLVNSFVIYQSSLANMNSSVEVNETNAVGAGLVSDYQLY